MDPEYSLLRLQQPATCPYPEPDLPLLRLYQRISPGPRQMYPFRNKAIFYDELLAPRQTSNWRTAPVGRPLLLIQYKRRVRKVKIHQVQVDREFFMLMWQHYRRP
jgi:hypothetical protein